MSSKFDALKIGDTASYVKTITEKDVLAFAELSGDKNPVHLDEEAAQSSIFKTRIAHGALVSSLFSTVIGMDLPGEGTIYLQQSSSFRKPVLFGDTITATVTITEKNHEKGRIELSTIATNQHGDIVVTGFALVKV